MYNPEFTLTFLEKNLDLERTPSAIVMNGKVVSGLTIKEVSETYDISADTLRYYERIGMIPEVTRTAGGIRDYQESDLGWVELVICMRKAGLPVEALIEYVKLYQEGDETFEARLQLLSEERREVRRAESADRVSDEPAELQNFQIRRSSKDRSIKLGGE